MAEKKEVKEEKPKLKGPVVCTTKCYHGKLWNPGEKTHTDTLTRLGGFVPEKHFSPVGSTAAQEVSAEGEQEAEKLRRELIARNIIPPVNASLAQLRKMYEKAQSKSVNPLE